MSEVLDLSKSVAHLHRDGSSNVAPNRRGPPKRIDGYSVGAPHLSRSAPHGGEMHPDGDELLFVVSGRMDVVLEENGDRLTVGKERTVE
ncbi:MAG: hypothetical protein P8Y95_14945, partial [Gammaproteobacteria bacterium]